MSLRFRKSIKVAPGVHLNISRKSVGVSVGGKGYRKSINSSGRVTTSIGVPGTGISYVKTENLNSRSKSASKRVSTAATAVPVDSAVSTAATAANIQKAAVQPKEKQPKTIAVLLDRPDASFVVFGIIVLVVAFFLSSTSIPIGIIAALIGVYLIYCYFAFKRHPEDPRYITEEQLTRWAQLVSSNKKTVHDLQKESLPILVELKKRTENYYNQLCFATSDVDIQKCSELLMNAQNKIIELSEFVILKGDEPRKDFEKYTSLVEEVK